MALHLTKLAVGVASVADLGEAMAARARLGPLVQVTRMVPGRAAEVLDGGSLYWVVRGQTAARQRLLAIEPFKDGEGIGRCRLVLDPAVVPVVARACRPFQGWRYLADADRPADLGSVSGALDLPERLRLDLAELGLL